MYDPQASGRYKTASIMIQGAVFVVDNRLPPTSTGSLRQRPLFGQRRLWTFLKTQPFHSIEAGYDAPAEKVVSNADEQFIITLVQRYSEGCVFVLIPKVDEKKKSNTPFFIQHPMRIYTEPVEN